MIKIVDFDKTTPNNVVYKECSAKEKVATLFYANIVALRNQLVDEVNNEVLEPELTDDERDSIEHYINQYAERIKYLIFPGLPK